MGREAAQKKMLKNMDEVFRAVQREHQIPFGDFPDMEKFKAQISELDWSKFSKLDLKAIEAMDSVLSQDVPALMAQFPSERIDEAEAGAKIVQDAGGATSARPKGPANPFAAFGGGSGADMQNWSITPSEQSKYRNIFQTCNPADGFVSGEAAKVSAVPRACPKPVLANARATSAALSLRRC